MMDIRRRIVSLIKIISEYLKDYRIKNSKPAIFIKCHTISLSLLIILFGILAISLSYYNQTVSNIILIDPHSATEGTVTNNTISYWTVTKSFNSQDTPLVSVVINIKHKKTLACSDNLNIDSIGIYIDKEAYSDIKEIGLWLKGSDGAVIRYFNFNLTNFVGHNSEVYYSDIYSEGFQDTLYISKQYDKASIWPLRPDSNNNVDFFYKLQYNDFKNQTFELNGKTNLAFPIRCMDSVEETNNSINNSIFRLTCVLVIFGAFPFFSALKQLLE
jgi:hypothetical protein